MTVEFNVGGPKGVGHNGSPEDLTFLEIGSSAAPEGMHDPKRIENPMAVTIIITS
jgi:hypothetical protein